MAVAEVCKDLHQENMAVNMDPHLRDMAVNNDCKDPHKGDMVVNNDLGSHVVKTCIR